MGRTALIVVDMQNAFVDPSAGLAVRGADRVLTAVNAWVRHANDQQWPVFFTRDIDPTGHSGPDAEHDVTLHPRLDQRGIVVDKGPGATGGFSGFVLASGSTPGGTAGGGGLSRLAPLLRDAIVDHVVVIGLAADVCVSATAVDARRLGYAVTVDLTASAFVHAHPNGDEAAVVALHDAGVQTDAVGVSASTEIER